MYNFNQLVHFIGIGGVGMAGIAEVLLNLGYRVSGSDIKQNKLTEHLQELGGKIFIGHAATNLPPETTVVVFSSAIGEANPEYLEAQTRNIPIIPRSEMLAELMRMKYGVVVAGSHGKTTTTSMIAKILGDAGLDPTVIVGGRVLTQTTGARVGTGSYLVAESDESDGSFCLLRPAIAVVTNIDREHLGYYGSFGALESAFARFMAAVPFYGLVVCCFDDPVVRRLAGSTRRRVLSYGFSPDCDIVASEVESQGLRSSYRLTLQGSDCGIVQIPMPGRHYVANSLAAFGVGLELGVYPEEIKLALEGFPGVARRSEVLFQQNDITLIDDYGHHPTEIAATLLAVRSGLVAERRSSGFSKGGRLIVCFQPHRFTRTREVFADFLSCFDSVDEILVGDIYSAGEEPIDGVSAESLVQAIQHPNIRYCPDLLQLGDKLALQLEAGDVLITLGAGSITTLAHDIASSLGRIEGKTVGRHDIPSVAQDSH